MRSNDMQLSYRSSAIEGASPIGLVVVLYDRLVADIRSAAGAIQAGDIEGRCRELNHASWILGQLEDWIDLRQGGELAENLSAFYSHLRGKLTEAAVSKSARVLEEQIELISHVRGAWQQRDARTSQQAALPSSTVQQLAVPVVAPQRKRTAFSQSA